MATKTSPKKAVAAKPSIKPAAKPAAKPATPRKPDLTRYVDVIGELNVALKQYQGLLKSINAGRKIDVKAFDKVVNALNKSGDKFDALTEKHENAILEYVSLLEVE